MKVLRNKIELCLRMQVFVRKFCRLKIPCLLLFFLFVLIYTFGTLYWILTQNNLGDPAFLETEKCPVCYGDSLCYTLYSNKIKNIGKGSLIPFERRNSKNVFIAEYVEGGKSVVFKKLGSNVDLSDLDAFVCRDSNMADSCDVSNAIPKSNLVKDSLKDESFAKLIHGISPLFTCPSTRLIDLLFEKYKERTSPDRVVVRDKVQIWTTAKINAESLILQMFPSSEGWPFPEYHGACGRYVAVENAGQPLSNFYSSSWQIRVELAFQLMKLAEFLTNNKEEFALYLGDVTYSNFAVDAEGKVRLIDLEDVIVVDKQAVKAAKTDGWNDIHESTYTECDGKSFKSCHSFSEAQLCSHVISDHNYYAICRHILSRYAADDIEADGQGHSDGLLHSMPESAKNDWDLEYLLNECVMPTRQRGRIQVVHKLIDALDNLRQKVS